MANLDRIVDVSASIIAEFRADTTESFGQVCIIARTPVRDNGTVDTTRFIGHPVFGAGTPGGILSRQYNNIEEVAADWADESDTLNAARAYFATAAFNANTPRPLRVACYAEEGQLATGRSISLQSDAVPGPLPSNTTASLTPIFSQIDVNGAKVTITLPTMEFSDFDFVTTNWNQVGSDDEKHAIASYLQTALRAVTSAETSGGTGEFQSVGTVEVVYDEGDNKFKVFSGINRATGGSFPAISVEKAGSGAAFNTVFRFHADEGGTHDPGDVHIEPVTAVTEFFSTLVGQNNDFYFVVPNHEFTGSNGEGSTDLSSIITGATSAQKMTMVDSRDQGWITSEGVGATSFNAIYDDNNSNSRLSIFYSGQDERSSYLSAATAGMFSNVDLDQGGSYITGKFKQLAGVGVDNLTRAQIDILYGRRINHYVPVVTGINILQEATTLRENIFIDMQHFLDWFVLSVRGAVFSVLANAPFVPQTAIGQRTISETIEGVCRTAVASGAISGGRLDPTARDQVRRVTGNRSHTGVLDTGYLVYADPVSGLDAGLRSERRLPTFHVWLKGSGAVHFADIRVVFDN